MGNGIAHVFARSGFDVFLCDIEQKFLDRALSTISKNVDREVAKNKITESQKSETLKRIEPVTDRTRLANCDFIVEAASEKLEIKLELFRELDRVCRPEIILASNTSSISITKLASATARPATPTKRAAGSSPKTPSTPSGCSSASAPRSATSSATPAPSR